MKKLIVLVKRREGLSPEEFREYYETRHAPMGMRVLGEYWSNYQRNYVTSAAALQPAGGADFTAAVAALAGTSEGALDSYDCVSQFWFAGDDFDRMQEMFANHPEVAASIQEDELRFMDRAKTIMFVVDEVTEVGEESPPWEPGGVTGRTAAGG